MRTGFIIAGIIGYLAGMICVAMNEVEKLNKEEDLKNHEQIIYIDGDDEWTLIQCRRNDSKVGNVILLNDQLIESFVTSEPIMSVVLVQKAKENHQQMIAMLKSYIPLQLNKKHKREMLRELKKHEDALARIDENRHESEETFDEL